MIGGGIIMKIAKTPHAKPPWRRGAKEAKQIFFAIFESLRLGVKLFIFSELLRQVSDPSGSALPGATVTAVQISTNQASQTTSNASGRKHVADVCSKLGCGHAGVKGRVDGRNERREIAVLESGQQRLAILAAGNARSHRLVRKGVMAPPTKGAV
jgi:hypothetical protein